MKKTYQFLMMLIASLVFISCGGDDGSDNSSSGGGGSSSSSGVTIVLRSQSISAGAEVDAASTTMLTLNYNTTVKVTGNGITLNGNPVTAKSNSTTTMSVDIPLSLEDGTSYTVHVAKGAIVSTIDATVSAPEFTLTFTTKVKTTPGSADNSATAMAKRLGWGWNLGNHFDTSSGKDGVHPEWGYWDQATPTADLYTNLKKAGASTVRIGVTWGNYQNSSWVIEPSYMEEVRQNVEWAEQAGLNVILNMHHDEYWLDIKTAANNATVNSNIKERIEKTWQQIANAFNDKGDFLIFESFNELQDGQWGWGDNLKDGGKQYNTLNEWNQLVVNTIRATGGNNATRWIGIPAYAASPSFALESSFKLPEDAAKKIMVSVHFYDPNTFTLTPENSDGKSEWGHTAAAGKFQSGSNEDHVTDIFSKLYEKFITQNIPVYIGEYGCVMHKTDRSNQFRNYYLEYVCRAAYTYRMPLCIWDNNVTGGGNEHHGYFNHSNGNYQSGMQTLVQTMIQAATSTDASYTLESVYNKAP